MKLCQFLTIVTIIAFLLGDLAAAVFGADAVCTKANCANNHPVQSVTSVNDDVSLSSAEIEFLRAEIAHRIRQVAKISPEDDSTKQLFEALMTIHAALKKTTYENQEKLLMGYFVANLLRQITPEQAVQTGRMQTLMVLSGKLQGQRVNVQTTVTTATTQANCATCKGTCNSKKDACCDTKSSCCNTPEPSRSRYLQIGGFTVQNACGVRAEYRGSVLINECSGTIRAEQHSRDFALNKVIGGQSWGCHVRPEPNVIIVQQPAPVTYRRVCDRFGYPGGYAYPVPAPVGYPIAAPYGYPVGPVAAPIGVYPTSYHGASMDMRNPVRVVPPGTPGAGCSCPGNGPGGCRCSPDCPHCQGACAAVAT